MLTQMLNNKIAMKTFIIQDEATLFSQVVMFPVDYTKNNMDLEELFSNKIPNYRYCVIRVYDFAVNQYVPIQQISSMNLSIPMNFINACNSVVLIKYKKCTTQSEGSIGQNLSERSQKNLNSQTSSHKKQRAKQRAISQVIQIVKRWRDLHIPKRGQKKVSLQQAAKIIGLPKKSLDDYYYQLRLGQKYGFDFKTKFFDRIGCLRNFLKQKKPRLKSQKSDKHPRSLKIIEQLSEMRMNIQDMKIQQEQIFEQVQIFQKDQQKFRFQQYEECQQMKLQNQFYQDFGFMESQQDPFVNLDPDFKKKNYQKLFDQQLFF